MTELKLVQLIDTIGSQHKYVELIKKITVNIDFDSVIISIRLSLT